MFFFGFVFEESRGFVVKESGFLVMFLERRTALLVGTREVGLREPQNLGLGGPVVVLCGGIAWAIGKQKKGCSRLLVYRLKGSGRNPAH